MSVVNYTTKDGDRWDIVAYRAYGDAMLFMDIVKANPKVPIYPDLPSGIILNIPVREREEVVTTNLPPWKQ